jgi:integrase
MNARPERGSVRLQGGRWVLRRRVDGRETRIHLGTKKQLSSLTAARAEADARLQAIHGTARSSGERITLEAFAPFFLQDVCAQKKPATRATYASVFSQHLLPELGGLALIDIGPREITLLISRLEKKSLNPRTVRLALTVLAFALSQALANGYAARLPELKRLRLGAKRVAAAPPRRFTLGEINRILELAAQPWRALFTLLAFTGMRCGEALGLAWRHIDFGAQLITLDRAAYMGRIQATKSAGSVATLRMPDRLAAELRDLQGEFHLSGDPEDLLFPSRRDVARPIWSSVVRRHLRALLDALGIAPAGLHAFRHTFATELMRQGTPVSVVKQLLRHADIKTTERYMAVTSLDQRAAADRFAAHFTLEGKNG